VRKVLHGRRFIDALIAQGVLPENATRVEIRADVKGVVTVDYETIGTEALLDVVPDAEVSIDEAVQRG